MTIIQTFITAPMTVERLKQNVIIAALSLAFAHRSGYKVKMYTDNLGKLLLSKLPYDEINTKLNDVQLPGNVLWSVGKYMALLREPLGTIHIDFDVMLKKPCLTGILDNADICAQIKEYIDASQPWYEEDRQFLATTIFRNRFDLTHEVVNTYNTGIIGYSNSKARDAHAKPIIQVYNRFKNYEGYLPALDFFIEQAALYDLSTKGYKVKALIKNDNPIATDYKIINDIADKVGYCHLQSKAKYSTEVMTKVIQILKVQFRDIYNSIRDIIQITKI